MEAVVLDVISLSYASKGNTMYLKEYVSYLPRVLMCLDLNASVWGLPLLRLQWQYNPDKDHNPIVIYCVVEDERVIYFRNLWGGWGGGAVYRCKEVCVLG